MASQPWVLEGRRKAERGYGREGECEPHQDSHIHESLRPGAHVRAEMPSGLPILIESLEQEHTVLERDDIGIGLMYQKESCDCSITGKGW